MQKPTEKPLKVGLVRLVEICHKNLPAGAVFHSPVNLSSSPQTSGVHEAFKLVLKTSGNVFLTIGLSSLSCLVLWCSYKRKTKFIK